MIEFIDLGLIEYAEAEKRQIAATEDVASNQNEREIVFFCRHPEVVTLGRASDSEEDVSPLWKGPVHRVSRGGKATYHGPEQLVVYPILNLTLEGRPKRDVAWYLRSLEQAVVQTLDHFGISSVGKTRQTNAEDEEESATGVWVRDRKICSVGVGVRKWTTYHGAAVCVKRASANAFRGINPCGFQPSVMTSIEEQINKEVTHQEVQTILEKELIATFSPRYD